MRKPSVLRFIDAPVYRLKSCIDDIAYGETMLEKLEECNECANSPDVALQISQKKELLKHRYELALSLYKQANN